MNVLINPPSLGRSRALAAPPGVDSAVTIAKRILLADDDAMVRSALAAVLESEGYKVDQAGDGVEAVRRSLAHPANLFLLDLNMPGVDGWAAFQQLERLHPLMPVIVITARPHQYDEALRLGVDAFMEKPLDLGVLLPAIRQLISEDEKQHMRRITQRQFATQFLRAETRRP
jgi:two-component system, OmpR family, response regulator MprA